MLNYKIALATRLNTLTTSLISGRLYYQFPPQKPTFPCVTYFIVTDIPALETGPNNIRIQIDVWGEEDIAIEQICEAIKAGLHNLPFAVTGAYHPFLMEITRKDLPIENDSTKVLHRVVEYRSLLYID